MGKVATSISLGLLIVDEFQNLKIAKTEQCVVVFNMFVQIIEDYGISIVTLCTPAIQKLLKAKIAITRKLMGNITYFPLMAEGGGEWKLFTDAVWPFCYTKEAPALTATIRTAWHKASGGNAAFAVHAYRLAQEYAITEDLSIDEVSFETVLNTSFAALKPAIDALVRGRPTELDAYEDLISDPENKALIAAFMPHAVYATEATALLGTTGSKAPADVPVDQTAEVIEETGEFEEVQDANGPTRAKGTVRASPGGKKAKASPKGVQPLPTRPVGADLV